MLSSLILLIKDFFGVSYKEARGVLLLSAILIPLIFAPAIIRHYYQSLPPSPITVTVLDSLLLAKLEQPVEQPTFSFDPNRVSADSLILTGLDSTIAYRILRYREKGGRFRTPEDIQKIYGLPEKWYTAIADCILIDLPSVRPVVAAKEYREPKAPPQATRAGNSTSKKPVEITPFDLNKADTTQLKQIYGIGPALSSRIVRFREKLGGFVSAEQLYQVYGLDSAVIDELLHYSFLDDGFEPKMLELNRLSMRDLAGHPYLEYTTAKAIVNYRNQHGPLTSEEDLQAIHLLSDSVIAKVLPYLSFE